jgi:excisionase family DNA binding protein
MALQSTHMSGSPPPDEDFLTVEEAQAYLGVGRAYLYRLAQRYKIPRFRRPVNGKKVLFRKSDLARLKEPEQKRPGK